MRAEPLGKRNAFRTASDRRRQLCFCGSSGSRDAFGFFVGAASAAIVLAGHSRASRLKPLLQTSRQLERAASLDCVFMGAAEAAMLSALCRSGFSRDYFGDRTAEHRGGSRSYRHHANSNGQLLLIVFLWERRKPRCSRLFVGAASAAIILAATQQSIAASAAPTGRSPIPDSPMPLVAWAASCGVERFLTRAGHAGPMRQPQGQPSALSRRHVREWVLAGRRPTRQSQ